MSADSDSPRTQAPRGVVPVAELRDYHQVNAEIVRLLDLGCLSVLLDCVEGQRLLVAGLAGAWNARVHVLGRAGPELAAVMDAPGVTVVCHGPAADGAGRAFTAGTLLILGPAGVALGYDQRGGLIVASGDAAARAGLQQRGGDLVVLGSAGPLAGERRAGGRMFVPEGRAGVHLGFGASGGRAVLFEQDDSDARKLSVADKQALDRARSLTCLYQPGPPE